MLALTSLLISCSTQTCKPNENIENSKSSNQPIASESASLTIKNMTTQIKKIKIYKPDGSVQCEANTGQSIIEMQKSLDAITVFSAEKKHDGLMRIQVCGQPTGQCNVYEIAESDLAKALSFGFKKWKNN